MNKNIVICGASGFIGSNLVKRYLSSGDNVFAIAKRSISNAMLNNINTENLNVFYVDINSYENLYEIIHVENVDVFYYLSWNGVVDGRNDFLIQISNIKPLHDALTSAQLMHTKRFIFASSLVENSINKIDGTQSIYGSAKMSARIIGQSIASRYQINFISVQLSNTFGPGDYSKRMPNKFIYSFIRDKDIDVIDSKDLYDLNYIDDAINGIILAGEYGLNNKNYYIGNKYRKTLYEIVSDIKNCLNSKSSINVGRYYDNYFIDYSKINVDELYNDTGYVAKTDFNAAIKLTAKWVETLNIDW